MISIPFQFSLHTLTAASLLPFIYFIYQTKFWVRPDILKRLDFLLLVTAAAFSVVFLLKAAELRGQPWIRIQFALLHFVGPVLTILIIRKTKLERWLNSKVGQQGGGNCTPPEATASFKPLPAGPNVGYVSWDDIVINQKIKEELLATIKLLQSPKEARNYGIEPPKGMLFYGPPGTGKTTIARAMANTAGLNFFSLKLDDVVSKWVGESEKNLSALFAAATKHAPAVIFFDEIDALGRSRGDKSQAWAENLLNHLLQLIDGVVKTEGIYIIGATNRVDLVDPALKRAGRLNKTIEIPNPDYNARVQLFSLYLNKLKLHEAVDLDTLASITDGCSGADIKEICNQAGLNAFKRESQDSTRRDYLVTPLDLQAALQDFSPTREEAA